MSRADFKRNREASRLAFEQKKARDEAQRITDEQRRLDLEAQRAGAEAAKTEIADRLAKLRADGAPAEDVAALVTVQAELERELVPGVERQVIQRRRRAPGLAIVAALMMGGLGPIGGMSGPSRGGKGF